MKNCACGAKPEYEHSTGISCEYAQLVCRSCGARGIKQAGQNKASACTAARATWEAGEREAHRA